LAQLAAERDLILMEDLGSGVLIDLAPFGLRDEPVVADILKAGVDLVMFSGDKLLGGPQAGIIAGRADIIAGLRKHPLLRALRIDKLSLAALEATLRLYLPPHDPLARVPVLRALSQPLAEVESRAQRLAGSLAAVKGVDVEVMASAAYVGGGSLPQQDLDSFSVVVASAALPAETLADRLRGGMVPIVGRIHQGKLWLDMRTVTDDELPDIVAALGAIAAT
jgi:L-seryl-tRNA(Ser) seleniumtransferase